MRWLGACTKAPGGGMVLAFCLCACGSSGGSPPNLVGNYTGQGTTTATTNSLWTVKDTAMFTAVVATQAGQVVSGNFTLGSFELDVPQAEITGSGSTFHITGTDTAIQGGCTLEAQGDIHGTVTAGPPMAISGTLSLTFTHNITGSGCTMDQMSTYPGTGATFDYVAQRTGP